MAAQKRKKRRQREEFKKPLRKPTIGIIGGSGLYSMAGLSDPREVRMKTPFGDRRPTPLCWARWKGSTWRFWRATAAATEFYRAKLIIAPTFTP